MPTKGEQIYCDEDVETDGDGNSESNSESPSPYNRRSHMISTIEGLVSVNLNQIRALQSRQVSYNKHFIMQDPISELVFKSAASEPLNTPGPSG